MDNKIVIKEIENRLVNMFPDMSMFKIRPLGRVVLKSMSRIDDRDFNITEVLARFEITGVKMIESFKALIKEVRSFFIELKRKKTPVLVLA